MGHGHPHHFAAVFKNKDVFDLFICTEGFIPLRPKVYQLFDVRRGQLRQGNGVLRRVEDHLALAVGGCRFKEIGGNRIRLGRILRQRRKIVVVFIDIEMLRDLAGTGTERAVVLGHLRAALPVGSDHDPVVCQWMFAQFSHIYALSFH